MATAIEFNNISKIYRLGTVSTGTLAHDIKRWWTVNVQHKEDPYLKIGETNDRSSKGESEYVWALKDIDFKVEQGDVVGIIGKNGAGKSTLLKILSKVTAPTTGSIRARGRIGSLLEVGTGFHPEMTGRENIYMNGAILGMTKQEIGRKLDEIVDFSGCERYIDTPVKRYSSGMMVRLGFAVAAHLDPEILVVDEVLAVGDAEFQKKAIGKMQDVSRGEGRTVLFVSHNMAAVKNLCKRGVLLGNGQVQLMGSVDNVVEEYLKANETQVRDIARVTEFNRVIEVYGDLEIMEVSRLSPYKVESTDDVVISVVVKRNNPQIKNFQLVVLVDNTQYEGRRVGMSISPQMVWEQNGDIATYEVTLKEHHCAKGTFSLTIWLCSGDVTNSFLHYDAVYGTVTFEVDSYNRSQIIEWHEYWGNSIIPMQIHN